MANEKIWKGKVENNNGMLLVWVNQSADTEIKKVNLGGVCFAICKDFLQASLTGFTELSGFCQAIEDQSKVSYNNRIPWKYVKGQAIATTLRSAFVLNAQTISRLIKETDDEPEKEKLRTELNEVLRLMDQKMYGNFKSISKGSNLFKAVAEMEAIAEDEPTDSAFLVEYGFAGKKTGHAISFIFLKTGAYPYRFFDPNLGVFCFKEVDDLDDFFDVVLVAYKETGAIPKNYTTVAYAK